MRLAAYLLIGLVSLATGFDAGAAKAHTAGIQSDTGPKIMNASVKGKKLFVIGENFSHGAVILVNGEPQKTKNDSDNPSTMLVAKKAGKRIPDNAVVSLQVQSAAGISDKFAFFKGRVVTLEDVGKTIELKVGERLLLSLQKGGYLFSTTVLDPTVLKKLPDVESVPGSQGVFEALRVGSTKLTALGELPCHKSTPACLAPTLDVEFGIVVVE